MGSGQKKRAAEEARAIEEAMEAFDDDIIVRQLLEVGERLELIDMATVVDMPEAPTPAELLKNNDGDAQMAAVEAAALGSQYSEDQAFTRELAVTLDRIEWLVGQRKRVLAAALIEEAKQAKVKATGEPAPAGSAQ